MIFSLIFPYLFYIKTHWYFPDFPDLATTTLAKVAHE